MNEPYKNKIFHDEALEGLKNLPGESFNCCVTSPPYWALRDYGVKGQLGLEKTPDEYIEKMVEIFREVKRVLRNDATLWLNIGDTYAGSGRATEDGDYHWKSGKHSHGINPYFKSEIVKPKDLIGIPWMLAFALRADGWYLRQDIIWSKPNPMPESVTDRCTRAHEYIFLLSKNRKYYYNYEALKEPASNNTHARQSRAKNGQKSNPDNKKNGIRPPKHQGVPTGLIKSNESFNKALVNVVDKRNKRSVWTVSPEAFKEAHFATYPQKLIKDCILAGSPENGFVLDPFMGAGTTAVVARKLNRNFTGFEINQDYIEISEKRLLTELGIFA